MRWVKDGVNGNVVEDWGRFTKQSGRLGDLSVNDNLVYALRLPTSPLCIEPRTQHNTIRTRNLLSGFQSEMDGCTVFVSCLESVLI